MLGEETLDTEKMKGQCSEVSSLLKAIAHPQRLMLMCYLSEGEKNVTELQELCGISQSQLSQFLNRMGREKLLKSRKDGTFVYYSVADKNILKLLQAMQRIFCGDK